jgi:hypothetical protein
MCADDPISDCHIHLQVPVTMDDDFGALELPTGVNITLHGGGFTINRNLQASVYSFCPLVKYDESGVADADVPAITLSNVVVTGFGEPTTAAAAIDADPTVSMGGVLSMTGPVVVTVTGCSFRNNNAAAGGAVFISHNSRGVLLENSSFLENSAWGGGAVYVGEDSSNIEVRNVTFSGNVAVVPPGLTFSPTQLPTGMPSVSDLGFPSSTGKLSLTDNANENYVRACVDAYSGQLLTFSSCDKFTGDPFFRLFDESEGTQLAFNDDNCHRGSKIRYTVPDGQDTRQFCLHVGCYADGECSMDLTVEVVDATSALSSFPTTPPTRDPTVTLQSVGMSGTLGSTVMGSNAEDYGNGGALLLNSGNSALRVHGSVFLANVAEGSGGGVFLGSDNSDISFAGDSIFENCVSSNSGGGVHLHSGNSDVMFSQTSFVNCTATVYILTLALALN